MGLLHIPSPARLLVCVLTAATIFATNVEASPVSSMEARTTRVDPIPGINVRLQQTRKPTRISGKDNTDDETKDLPAVIKVTVTNTNAFPISFISYDSPLDPLALALGLFHFTPEGANEPVVYPTIKIKRVWPPKPDAYISLAAGAKASRQFEITDPVDVSELGVKATVELKGQWLGVFPKAAKKITKAEFQEPGDYAFTGPFATKPLKAIVGPIIY